MKKREPHEVLCLLASAKPREGLEARMMARLAERREEAQRRSRWLAFWREAVSWRGAIVAATIAVAVANYGLLSGRGRLRGTTAVVVPVMPMRSVAPSVTSAAVLPAVVPQVTAKHLRREVSPSARTLPVKEMPLTGQEKLLLEFAAVERKARSPNFKGIAMTEIVENHGLGKDAILELSQQTVQPMPYHSPGETE